MISGDGNEHVANAIEKAIEEGSRLPKGEVAGVLTKLVATPLMVDFISQHGHAAEFTAQLEALIRSRRLQEASRTHQAQVDSQAQRSVSDTLIDDGQPRQQDPDVSAWLLADLPGIPKAHLAIVQAYLKESTMVESVEWVKNSFSLDVDHPELAVPVTIWDYRVSKFAATLTGNSSTRPRDHVTCPGCHRRER